MRRTTQTQQLTLFDQLISQTDKDNDPKDQSHKLSINNQNQQSISNIKSLHNLHNIFYQNTMNYKDYKQSLLFNHKKLEKIVLQNIKNPHQKLIKNLAKYSLINLKELTLDNIDVIDSQFQIFQQKGGFSKNFLNLINVTLICPNITSLTIDYLFQGIQNIQYLDLSHTKIDNQGIYKLSHLQWPFLETFIIQWCNSVHNLDQIGNNAKNFPNLKIIDSCFIQTENESYNQLINSPIIITLTHLRLFGTNVNLKTSYWQSTYLLNLFMNSMKDYNLQEFRIQNEPACHKSSSDYKQLQVNTLISTEAQKLQLNISWKITALQAQIQFIDTIENVDKKFANFGKLFEFLQKQQQLKKSLQNLSICFDLILCDTNNFDIILKTIVDFKELKKLKFYVRNQTLLKLPNYFFFFNQISELHQLMYLQLDLQNNEILINESFLNKIVKSVQQLSYLNLLYLNLRHNKIKNILDIHSFNSQIIKSIKNPYLNHIYLMETNGENLNYKYKDALTLVHSSSSKFVNINEFQNIIVQQDPSNIKEKIFKYYTEQFYKKKMKLIRSCVLSRCHQLNYENRFRQQVIYQILDMIIYNQ